MAHKDFGTGGMGRPSQALLRWELQQESLNMGKSTLVHKVPQL